MVQVKKATVHDAILESAGRLFRETGYTDTPMAAIARDAGVTVSNIYVYFASKLELFYAVYEPWLITRFDAMAVAVRAKTTPHEKVRCLLEWLWARIPAEDNYFSNNLIEAISTSNPADGYTDDCLLLCQERVAGLLREIGGSFLPEAKARDLSFVVMMTFDGFSLKVRTSTPQPNSLFDTVAQMIVGTMAA